MKKIAFIGSGTMGTALATAACKGIDPSEVVITDVVTEKGQKLADELGCNFVETNGEAIKAAYPDRTGRQLHEGTGGRIPVYST